MAHAGSARKIRKPGTDGLKTTAFRPPGGTPCPTLVLFFIFMPNQFHADIPAAVLASVQAKLDAILD
jgi:hypothetical protein